jgi:hypothetical protein
MKLMIAVLVLFNLYLAVNVARLIKRRAPRAYRWKSFARTTAWLLGLQVIVIAISKLADVNGIGLLTILYVLAGAQLLGSFIILATTVRNLKSIRPSTASNEFADHDLPNLTVCIPARNETEDLENCLLGLIASDYPKLEILVLDDCSQNSRTPEIIRSFAQRGVRFIAGTAPSERWLAKNHAYSQLAAEANGELLLFCGVDVRFEPQSLSLLAKAMLSQQKSMLSLLPKNLWPAKPSLEPYLAQPSRYSWELMLPRSTNRPAVLSSCWLITAEALKQSGGLAAVSRKVVPESYFASQTATKGNYLFMAGGPFIGITAEKSLAEQQATAIRVRYPQLHRRPELVALVTLAEFLLLVCPLAIALAATINGLWILTGLAGVAYLLASVSYGRIINLTYRQIIAPGMFVLPLAALHDIGLLNYSMWQYECREVIWKGRNVCLPVMRSNLG